MNHGQTRPESPARVRVREAIREDPGIHFRGLARAAEVTSAGQLRHHVDRLMRAGLVVELPDGHFRRYFLANAYDIPARRAAARFSRPVPRAIARLLLQGVRTRRELGRALRHADSTLGYHLNRMVRAGDVRRERVARMSFYWLRDRSMVHRVLAGEAPDGPPERTLFDALAANLAGAPAPEVGTADGATPGDEVPAAGAP